MLKLVTVLFADVVGSTARAEKLHPEDIRALMSDYFAAMANEIQAEGGTVEKFVGDAIMAVFGVPTAHEDDAVRAVRAARRMLARLRSWNESREPGQRIEIRIGLNTGQVVASGTAGGDLLVTGDAVNMAARLEQAAEPGTILVGDRTARAVQPYFDLRRIEPLELKGKEGVVTAWAVEGEREAPEPRGVPGLRAPLVGREHELAFLVAAWERVCGEGRPQLVTLLGDAGVGKSRLVREFVSTIEVEAKVLVGRCLPYGEGVTLWPLAEILKAEAVVLDTDSSDVAVAKIAQLVEGAIDPELAGDRPRTAAALVSTLGVQTADDPLGALDPRDLYRERLVAWRALLTSMARLVPVVAVVEDIHWADATMLDVLDELAERVEGPILFLCPARPDLLRTRPDWGGGRRSFSSLPLDPLSSEDSARLVSFLLDVDELPQGVRGRILERSEGNPFFLEEIVRHLIDHGLVMQENGRWRAQAEIGDVEIPDNVQAVILARLDLLSREEKRVVQRAAVIGRLFWDGAVARLAAVDDLDAVLRTLRRRELVLDRLSSSIGGQAEYTFKHVLIRDVAYESLPRKERGRAHAETAAWIEETSGERAGEFAELLAHHYDAALSFAPESDLRAKARGSCLTAAQNALRRFAIEQGERFAQRAVELSEGPAKRMEALEALGDLYYLAFNGDAAYRAYRDALDAAAGESSDLARLAGKAALFGARWVGASQQLAPAEEVAQMIEAGLKAAAPHTRERTLLLVDKGFLLAYRERGRDSAAQTAVREAERAAEELGDANLLSSALDLVDAWDKYGGRYGDAYRTSQRRLEFVSRMTDVKEIGDTYAMAADSALHLGRYAEAEMRATECIERSRGVDSGSFMHGLTWRVGARFMLGRWDEALADQTELDRLAAQDPRELPAGYTMRAYTFRALCHELRGEAEEADRYIEVSSRYFEFIRARLPQPQSSVHSPPLSLALAHRGLFDEARAMSPLVPRTAGSGLTFQVLCEIVAAQGSWDEADSVVAAARGEAEIGEQFSLPLYADRLEGRAAAAAGDFERAGALLRRSADGFAALSARWEEAWSRLLLAEVLLAGELQDAGREVTAALEVFDQLGSMQEAERARGLLADIAV